MTNNMIETATQIINTLTLKPPVPIITDYIRFLHSFIGILRLSF